MRMYISEDLGIQYNFQSVLFPSPGNHPEVCLGRVHHSMASQEKNDQLQSKVLKADLS